MHNTLLSQYNSNCHNLVRTTPLKSNTDSVRRTRKPATASGSRTAPIQTPNSTSPLLGTSSSQLQLYAATANPRPGSTAPTFKRSRVFPVSLVSSAPTPFALPGLPLQTTCTWLALAIRLNSSENESGCPSVWSGTTPAPGRAHRYLRPHPVSVSYCPILCYINIDIVLALQLRGRTRLQAHVLAVTPYLAGLVKLAQPHIRRTPVPWWHWFMFMFNLSNSRTRTRISSVSHLIICH